MSTERLLDTFLDLVRIDNPSGEEAAMVAYIRNILEGELGLHAEQDESLNLLVAVPGTGKPLLFNAHTDSVKPCVGVQPVVEDGVVRSSGDTVLGADDLAGVIAIIEGLRRVREAGQPHRAAEILLTTQEEVGLLGAKAFNYSRLRAREGVTFDSTGDIGGMCIGGPSQINLEANMLGKAAHAGLHPEQGISAIRVAAEAIAAMPLGRIDEETTANIGMISGGEATNIVPPRVNIRGEARSHNPAKLEAQADAMAQALRHAAAQNQARVEIHLSHPYHSYRLREDEPVVQYVSAALRRLGVEPYTYVSGGGSDVNVFAQHGLHVVNLSLGYQDIHTVNESITVENLERAAQLVTLLLAAEAA
jgi:tripeptide aminopeptidase